MLKKLNNGERFLLCLTSAVILAWPFLDFVVDPLNGAVSGLAKRIDDSELKLKEYKNIMSHEAESREFFNALPLAQKSGAATAGTLPLVLKDLEGLSSQAGLKLSDVRPLARVTKKSRNEITVELKVEGTMPEISRFLYSLEVPAQIMIIKKIDLAAKSGDVINANIVVVKSVE